jgi:hypothetical protein
MFWIFLILICLASTDVCLAATADDGRWHAGIGDPTIWGWITVVVYVIATYRCFLKTYLAKNNSTNYFNWLCLAIFLLLLGINKQLDLQTLFTEIFRDLANAHGWYEQRRKVQIFFIAMVGITMSVALILLRMYLYEAWRKHKLIWYGMFFLCTFIISRAASFHHVDILINTKLFGLKMNFILENGALLLVILGTYAKQETQKNKEPLGVQKQSGIVEMDKEGGIVRCPECGVEATASAMHGRKFKCKHCQFTYRVRIKNF